jgi:hypothetical protein
MAHTLTGMTALHSYITYFLTATLWHIIEVIWLSNLCGVVMIDAFELQNFSNLLILAEHRKNLVPKMFLPFTLFVDHEMCWCLINELSISKDEHSLLSSGQCNVDPIAFFQESNLIVFVAPDTWKNNDFVLLPLVVVNGHDFYRLNRMILKLNRFPDHVLDQKQLPIVER